jgi:hypothetical protein
LSGYPNSLFSFLNGFDAANTIFNARAVNNLQCFDIVNTNFTSYAAFTGSFLAFPNEITDTGNNFDGFTYVVPAAGIYSFQLSVSLAGVFAVDDRWGAAVIKHYDGAGVFIADYQGAVVQDLATNAIVCTSSATFVCNQGDKVRGDVAAVLVGIPVLETQCINFQLPSITFFSGSGVPFTPSTLQPVDIDDVQAYLYKFKRPLTMAEINAITSETSKPILLGRQDDALATIPTYIKRLQIDSVLRKNSQFELRSNKLIQ